MALKLIDSERDETARKSACDHIQKADAYLAITCINGHWQKHCVGMNDQELVYYLEKFKQQVLNDEW